jgi:thiamine pyrophosphokinase
MKAVILLNGYPPPKDLCINECRKADLIIAADGAGDYALGYGIIPDIVIGDMDSVKNGQSIRDAVKEFIVFPEEKDEVDSQLAIDMAVKMGADSITLLGMTGSRLDHSYANIMLMLRAARAGIDIAAIDEFNEFTVRTGEIKINGEIGDIVSLLPIGSDVYVELTKGLKYGVFDKIMPLDLPYGVSNIMTSQTAYVKVKSGYLLVVRIKRT